MAGLLWGVKPPVTLSSPHGSHDKRTPLQELDNVSNDARTRILRENMNLVHRFTVHLVIARPSIAGTAALRNSSKSEERKKNIHIRGNRDKGPKQDRV